MDADQFYKSKGGKYLKASELVGQEWELTVAGVEEGGEGSFYPLYLAFHEITEIWGLNKGNFAIIKENMGSAETEDWIGKKVVLYGARGPNKDGEMVDIVKARPKEREVKRVVPGKRKGPSLVQQYDELNPPPRDE